MHVLVLDDISSPWVVVFVFYGAGADLFYACSDGLCVLSYSLDL